MNCVENVKKECNKMNNPPPYAIISDEVSCPEIQDFEYNEKIITKFSDNEMPLFFVTKELKIIIEQNIFTISLTWL